VTPGREDYSNISSTGGHDHDDPATGRCSHEATSGRLPRVLNCFTQSSTTRDEETRERDWAAREERRERDREAKATAKRVRDENRARKAANRARKEEARERREDEQDEWEKEEVHHDRIVDGRHQVHQVFEGNTCDSTSTQILGNRRMPATVDRSSSSSSPPFLHGLLQNWNPFGPEERDSHELAKVVLKRKRNPY